MTIPLELPRLPQRQLHVLFVASLPRLLRRRPKGVCLITAGPVLSGAIRFRQLKSTSKN